MKKTKKMDNILDTPLSDKDFETFQTFTKAEHADTLLELLKEAGIPYSLETNDILLDKAIVGSSLMPAIALRIPRIDFKRVNKLLENEVNKGGGIPSEHFLYEFSEEELIDVIRKPDEWNPEVFVYARMLLRSKGIHLEEEDIKKIREERLQDIRKGEKAKKGQMLFYLALSILGALFLHPLSLIAGLGMGLYYWRNKDVDPEGHYYYTYEETTRNFGKIIFFVGLISSILVLYYFGLRTFSVLGTELWF